MKKKMMAAVAVAALGTTLAFAMPHDGKGGEGRHHRHGDMMGERMAEKLNLSEAQKQQMKDARKEFQEQNKAFLDTFRSNMKAFHEAKEANDTAKVTALKPTVDAQRQQMDALRQSERDRMMSFLTPTQKAQFDQMQKERAAKWAEHEKNEQNENHNEKR